MYKKIRLFALVVQIAIEAILLIVLFNTVDKARLSEQVFWVAFSFSFILNLLVAVGLFFLTKKKADEWLTLPALYYVSYVISVIYLVVGMIFMYAPITDPTWVWVVEAVLTIIFIVVVFYFILGSQYINQNTKKVKAKVSYIREAKAICDDLAGIATHEESKKALEKLAEDIRFSDPMSDDSVAQYEKEIYDALLDMQEKLDEKADSDVLESVKVASRALKRRNSLIQIRK